MRFGIGSLFFIGVMLGAAGLSLLRVLLVATGLPKLDFGTYAAIVATGAFLGSVISFGAVEGTVKTFPRLVANGQLDEVRHRAHGLLRVLVLRALAAGGPIFLLGLILSSQILMIAGVAFLFALSASYTSLVASMQRAVGDSRRLAAGTVFRAVTSFVAVAVTAQVAGLAATIIAEALAAIVGCYLSERLYLRGASTQRLAPLMGAEAEVAASPMKGDGVRVFLAYTAVSVPYYLDRIYVAGTLGANAAAEYALLALFLMAASLLVNAVAQRVGPDAIKLVMKPDGAAQARRYVLGWCGITTVIWIAALSGTALFLHHGWVPASLAKYEIEPAMLLPLGVLGVLFNSALIEFLIIALDRERSLLGAALSYMGGVVLVALAVAALKWDLYSLIWLLAGARLLYCLLLMFALRSATPANKATTL